MDALLPRQGEVPATEEATPALRPDLLPPPDLARLEPAKRASRPPRILLLYGSLRERSYSRFLTLDAERILRRLGAETRVFHPHGLPVADSVAPSHPKVAELRTLSQWSEGQVWCSPERHGAVTGVFKNQIDWLPLSQGALRPNSGSHARGDAGLRRFAKLQCCQHAAPARPLDAHGHHP